MNNENPEINLQLERLNSQLSNIGESIKELKQVQKGTDEIQQYVTSEISKYALALTAGKLDKTRLNEWFQHSFYVYKDKRDDDNSWHLAIPSFVDGQFGYLEKIVPGWNVFLVNPYAHWLGDIPDALKKKLGIKDPLDVFLDGDKLIGKDRNKVQIKLKPFIKKIEKDHFIVDKSRHFELLAALIKEGILPFTPKPVDQSDLILENRFTEEWELHDYHLEAWETFLKYSNIGYFLPPSGGKTYFSIHACGNISGPNLITVPSRELREQWITRLELYTDLKVTDKIEDGYDVCVVTYQYAIKHAHKFKWNLVIVDEVHHLPANLFSHLATIPRKYFIGLSATPQREDNREEMIFALTGKPCGLSWSKMKELGIIQNPDLNVWIVKDEKERLRQLDILLSTPGQTIIFSDSIKLGEQVSKIHDIPFVHGSSKIRIKDLEPGINFVCSRVGDEGISLPDIRRVIEIDWLHGSRRQELQRFTRILHGKNKEAVGHIIMTLDQYKTDRKRLFGVMEKGFKIILHREGFSDKEIIQASQDKPIVRRKPRISSSVKVQRSESTSKNNHSILRLLEQVKEVHPILSLPGIYKKISSYSKNELLSLKLFFSNTDGKYSKEDVCLAVGGGRPKDFASFAKMQKDGLIKKIEKSNQYQANLELSRLTN